MSRCPPQCHACNRSTIHRSLSCRCPVLQLMPRLMQYGARCWHRRASVVRPLRSPRPPRSSCPLAPQLAGGRLLCHRGGRVAHPRAAVQRAAGLPHPVCGAGGDPLPGAALLRGQGGHPPGRRRGTRTPCRRRCRCCLVHPLHPCCCWCCPLHPLHPCCCPCACLCSVPPVMGDGQAAVYRRSRPKRPPCGAASPTGWKPQHRRWILRQQTNACRPASLSPCRSW